MHFLCYYEFVDINSKMLITDDVWIKEVREQALKAGFEESTISVANSWCKEIFCLGCDLLTASFHTSPIEEKNSWIRITARMTDGNYEVTIQIDILKDVKYQKNIILKLWNYYYNKHTNNKKNKEGTLLMSFTPKLVATF